MSPFFDMQKNQDVNYSSDESNIEIIIQINKLIVVSRRILEENVDTSFEAFGDELHFLFIRTLILLAFNNTKNIGMDVEIYPLFPFVLRVSEIIIAEYYRTIGEIITNEENDNILAFIEETVNYITDSVMMQIALIRNP